MKLDISAKNVNLTEKLREYTEKKLAKLDRYLPSIVGVNVELTQEKQKQGGDRAVAQLTVREKHGAILRAEDKSQADIFAAIDIAIDKMYRQISRYKGKRERRAGDKFASIDPELAMAEDVPNGEDLEEENAIVIRRKRIESASMSEDEAIDQIELLGHDFFVFYNADSGMINVLYRRKAGGYGILEPEKA